MGELYHYGIQGQKWGVRRYQNEDGSLTAEGKKRYDSLTTAEQHRFKKQINYLRRRQNSLNKKFDKHTEKILKDKAEGKKISEKRINKAIKLGTKVRVQDRKAKDIRQYSEHLRKLETGAKIGSGISSAVTGVRMAKILLNDNLSGYGKAVMAGTEFLNGLAGATGGAILGLSVGAIAESLNGDYRRFSDKIYEESKNVTIEDLKKHGIIN